MDAILTSLLQFGIGGLMAAAIVGFLRHLVYTTLPEQRREFLAALRDQQASFERTLDKQEIAFNARNEILAQYLARQWSYHREPTNPPA